MASLTWPDPLPSFGPVVLRPFRDTDVGLVAELSSDPYLPLIGTIPAVYSEEAAMAYVARQQQRLRDGSGYSFAIADRNDDRALGGASLWPDEAGALARLGYAVAPGARRRGVATAALTALTTFGWSLPGLSRLELCIEPGNVGSIRAAEKCGYQFDALLPEHTEIGGERRDMVRYVRLRTGSD